MLNDLFEMRERKKAKTTIGGEGHNSLCDMCDMCDMLNSLFEMRENKKQKQLLAGKGRFPLFSSNLSLPFQHVTHVTRVT